MLFTKLSAINTFYVTQNMHLCFPGKYSSEHVSGISTEGQTTRISAPQMWQCSQKRCLPERQKLLVECSNVSMSHAFEAYPTSGLPDSGDNVIR